MGPVFFSVRAGLGPEDRTALLESLGRWWSLPPW